MRRFGLYCIDSAPALFKHAEDDVDDDNRTTMTTMAREFDVMPARRVMMVAAVVVVGLVKSVGKGINLIFYVRV